MITARPEPTGFFATERPHGGVAAQMVAFALSRGVLLGATVLTARTVGVDSFASFALAVVAYQAGLLLRDAGLGQALVILGGRTSIAAWPVFLITSGLGLAIGVAMGLVGGPLGASLGISATSEPAWILSLAFALGSLGVASNATLERSLRFVARAAVDAASYTALGIVTVAGLLVGAEVSALAWGYVAQAAVQSVAGLAIAPPWHGRHTGPLGIRPLLGYGGLLWASALLSYLSANLDNIAVAAIRGAAALGTYSVSYTVGNTIPLGLSQVVNRMALAWYARFRNDVVPLTDAFGALSSLAIGLSSIVALSVIAFAPEIAALVFNDGTTYWPIVVLGLYALMRVFGMCLGTMLNAIGAAGLTVRAGILNVAVMIAAVPPAAAVGGPTGAAIAVLVAMGFSAGYLARQLAGRLPGALSRLAPQAAVFGAILGTGAVSVFLLPPLARGFIAVLGGILIGGWLIRLLMPGRLPLSRS